MCEAIEHIVQRKREVGAGITIGHRKYIDLVDVILVADDMVDAGNQRIMETGRVDVSDSSHVDIITANAS